MRHPLLWCRLVPPAAQPVPSLTRAEAVAAGDVELDNFQIADDPLISAARKCGFCMG